MVWLRDNRVVLVSHFRALDVSVDEKFKHSAATQINFSSSQRKEICLNFPDTRVSCEN